MLRSMRSSLGLGSRARAAYRSAAARTVPTPTYFSRGNATAATPVKTEAKQEAKQQYVTLQEIDRLLTHISREYQWQSLKRSSSFAAREALVRVTTSPDLRSASSFHHT